VFGEVVEKAELGGKYILKIYSEEQKRRSNMCYFVVEGIGKVICSKSVTNVPVTMNHQGKDPLLKPCCRSTPPSPHLGLQLQSLGVEVVEMGARAGLVSSAPVSKSGSRAAMVQIRESNTDRENKDIGGAAIHLSIGFVYSNYYMYV